MGFVKVIRAISDHYGYQFDSHSLRSCPRLRLAPFIRCDSEGFCFRSKVHRSSRDEGFYGKRPIHSDAGEEHSELRSQVQRSTLPPYDLLTFE